MLANASSGSALTRKQYVALPEKFVDICRTAGPRTYGETSAGLRVFAQLQKGKSGSDPAGGASGAGGGDIAGFGGGLTGWGLGGNRSGR
jgi:hypothetical protein